MKRLLKLSAPLFAIAAVLGLASITQADDDQPSLDRFNFGTHVHGPAVAAEDIQGKVVVIEYWGDRCGPCIRAIPHLAELRGEYTTDQLMIVANQTWTQNVDQARDAWVKAGGGDDISVINHGGLRNTQVRGVPHSFVFDHEGNLLWRGHPMDPNFHRTVENAIANLPEPTEAPAE